MTVNCQVPFLFASHPSASNYYPRKSRPLLTSRYRHFPANITIKHWQLRDLVSTTNHGTALYPSNNEIRQLDLVSGSDTAVTQLPFDARCLEAASTSSDPAASSSDLIVAAGLNDSARHTPKGTFAVYCESTYQLASHELGDYINNSVAVFNHEPSRLNAVVCNNDHNVYFLDVAGAGGDMTVGSTLNLGAALNHAAVSPDGKTAVVLGDFPEITICHSDSRAHDWHVSETLHSSHDLGFSAAFHPSGTMFAAAFQKGVANLYDVRNTSRPMTMIYSTRSEDMAGAFRSLKFTTGSEDLVFLSEQNDRVHIVDLRDFDCHQVLNVPTLSPTGQDSYFEAYTTNEIFKGDDDDFVDDGSRSDADGDTHHHHNNHNNNNHNSNHMDGSSDDEQKYSEPSSHRRNLSVSSNVSDTSTIQCYQDLVEPAYQSHSAHSSSYSYYSPPPPAPRGLAIASGSSPIPMRIHTGVASGDAGLSGLAWSNYGSGSLVIGTCRGIGVWTIDGWGRRTFPSFSIR